MGRAFTNTYGKSYKLRPSFVLIALPVFIFILFCPAVASAVVDVTLAWDASSGATGYRLYFREDGQNYDYGSADWEGTGTTGTISGLDESTTYHFVVRAFNDHGESGNSNEAHLYSGVTNQAPTASFTVSPSSGNAPLTVTFNGSSSSDPDGSVVSYSWNFGDSSTGSGVTTSHTYNTFGNYDVTLMVTDDGVPAESDATNMTITVTDPAVTSLPPHQAVITSPNDGEIETDVLLSVETEPFSDPDGDTHSETKWRIVKAADSAVVLEITSGEHLTELHVPHSVLDPNTTYNVSVQFFDAYSKPSLWSESVEFTTHNDIVDFDGDGIPDAFEVDDTVDLNEDGIPDNDQPDVIKSVLSAAGDNKPLGVSKVSASIDAIETLEPINPATILDKTHRPETLLFGLVSYRLRLSQIGATVLVRVYYSEDISEANKYYVYDTVHGWQDYTQYVTFQPDGKSVIVELQDGGQGDSDGVANGVIVDPGGIVNSGGGVDAGAAGGGCFIATAAFGSHVEPPVKLLRDFRDRYLLTNAPGKFFVKRYYKRGPSAAGYIEEHDWLKPVVRILLMPLVGVSYILVRTSLATAILLGFMLIVSFLTFYSLIYKGRRRRA